MSADPGSAPPLRDWAFAAYRRPGVEEACLELQDRHGMDVVALLWCTWAGEHHGAIDAEAMAQVVTEIGGWQSRVVAPLRAVRRHLKQTGVDAGPAGVGPDAVGADSHHAAQDRLRRQVAEAELAAEVIQLDRLDSSTLRALRASSLTGPPGAAAVRANLACLAAAAGYDPDRGGAAAVEVFLTGVAGAGS